MCSGLFKIACAVYLVVAACTVLALLLQLVTIGHARRLPAAGEPRIPGRHAVATVALVNAYGRLSR